MKKSSEAEVTLELSDKETQGTRIDPRELSVRRDGLQRALDLVTTDYVTQLTSCPVLPMSEQMHEQMKDIAEWTRLYHMDKVVYAPKENFLQKITTVLYTAYAQDTPVVVLVASDGKKTDYYIGVQTTEANDGSQGTAFQDAFTGNFAGSELNLCDNTCVRQLSEALMQCENVTAVSGLPSLRGGEDKFNIEGFVQGIENMVDSLRGCSYTMLVKADPVQRATLLEMKRNYEKIYSQLSSFGKSTYSFNQTDTDSLALSEGVTDTHTEGTSDTETVSDSHAYTEGSSHTENINKSGQVAAGLKVAGAVVGGIIGATQGGSVGALVGAVGGGVIGGTGLGGLITPFINNTSEGTNTSTSDTHSTSSSHGTNQSDSRALSNTQTNTQSSAAGRTVQFTYEDRRITDILKIIEENIKRIDLCSGFGAFSSAAYVASDSPVVCSRAACVYNALMRGEKSALQSTQINSWQGCQAREITRYLGGFFHPRFQYQMGDTETSVTAAMLISSQELSLKIGLPKRSFPGVQVVQHAEFDCNPPESGNLRLGDLYRMGKVNEGISVKLSNESLTAHTFIAGSTGAGKSNAVYHMLNELTKNDEVHFLVVEPAKGEYKDALGGREDVKVYGTNPQKTELLRINPFSFPVGEIHVLEHLDRLVEIFNVCWPMYAAMPAILKDACERAYIAAGWNLTESVNRYDNRLFPTFADVLEQIRIVVNETEYSADTGGDYKGALVTRVKSLTTGLNGQTFASNALRDEDLFDKNVIVDLSRAGSPETKALIMGLLVMKLQEYRMAKRKDSDSALRHVTVLEEAHNLLKRTSTEQSSDSANLLGKSVEMLGNAIAEMRTYGEGFIIADQAPGLMDMAVIRNTNTKIIMRLPDQGDRELVGKAAGLDEEQIKELAKLPTGVAAVYQNEWLAPVLCKIDHFTDKKDYKARACFATPAVRQMMVNREILNILAKNHAPENLENFWLQVLKTDMKASLKCFVFQYLKASKRTADERIVLLMRIAASFFQMSKCLSRFAEQKDVSPEKLEIVAREAIGTCLDDFNEQEQETLLTLAIEGACLEDIKNTDTANIWREMIRQRGLVV